jgi:hypothetical protein
VAARGVDAVLAHHARVVGRALVNVDTTVTLLVAWLAFLAIRCVENKGCAENKG